MRVHHYIHLISVYVLIVYILIPENTCTLTQKQVIFLKIFRKMLVSIVLPCFTTKNINTGINDKYLNYKVETTQ